jgi:hypothetical protein
MRLFCLPLGDQADPDFNFEVSDVVLHLERAFSPGESTDIRSMVGELLQLEGVCARVHWLDGSESSAALKEV